MLSISSRIAVGRAVARRSGGAEPQLHADTAPPRNALELCHSRLEYAPDVGGAVNLIGGIGHGFFTLRGALSFVQEPGRLKYLSHLIDE
jgi:hypothetical protein